MDKSIVVKATLPGGKGRLNVVVCGGDFEDVWVSLNGLRVPGATVRLVDSEEEEEEQAS